MGSAPGATFAISGIVGHNQREMTTCPRCEAENPEENRYCVECGAELQPHALIISQPAAIEIGRGELATPQLKALAVTVGIGLLTLLVEAGLSYLQRRLAAEHQPLLSWRRQGRRETAAAPIVPKKRGNGRIITVVGERVVEEIRWGRPARRVVERFAWRGEERAE